MALRTDYKDSIPTTPLRKYQQIDNGDGTVSFQDVTEYSQVGDKAQASVFNGIGNEVNQKVDSATLNGTAVPKNGNTLVLPSSLPNPSALNISVGNGGNTGSYTGTSALSITIPKVTKSTTATPSYTLAEGELYFSPN